MYNYTQWKAFCLTFCLLRQADCSPVLLPGHLYILPSYHTPDNRDLKGKKSSRFQTKMNWSCIHALHWRQQVLLSDLHFFLLQGETEVSNTLKYYGADKLQLKNQQKNNQPNAINSWSWGLFFRCIIQTNKDYCPWKGMSLINF